MKKLGLFLSLTFCALLVKAQDNNAWNSFNGKIYGTELEYKKQINLREKAGYELYQLLGYKSYFTNGPASYLQQTKGFTLKESETENCIIYTLTNKADKSAKFVLKFWTDDEDRITKAKFYGNKQQLAELFANYWPSEKETVAGSITEKQFLTEKIVFNYSSDKPFIEVLN